MTLFETLATLTVTLIVTLDSTPLNQEKILFSNTVPKHSEGVEKTMLLKHFAQFVISTI